MVVGRLYKGKKMSAPRFVLGLKASGRKALRRKLKTVFRVFEGHQIIEELRRELIDFVDSEEFVRFVMAACMAEEED